MNINKYLPFALLFFFLNSAGLPFGLTYTALLTPFFYWWVMLHRKQEVLLPFLATVFPLVLIHFLIVGVDEKVYFISLFNLAAVYIFCQAFYTFLKRCDNVEKIFRIILYLNFILCLVAVFFYFTNWREVFWIKQELTEGVENFYRLRLFTYEASYYATLFIPVFLYFFIQIVLKQNRVGILLLLPLLFVPLILSFSVGVIAALVAAGLFTFIFHVRHLILQKRVIQILLLGSVLLVPFAIYLFFINPDNIVVERLSNIFTGRDSSGRGRTYEAFTLATDMISRKNEWWGIGPGQVKIFGSEIIRDFYLYPMNHTVFTIPNAAAESLAIFGWIGLISRLGIELILFFHTRVWTSYFRLTLFVFIFIYQFAGSFITSLAEYVIWILAFTEVFPRFIVQSRQPGLK
jgi:hypothetical protein